MTIMWSFFAGEALPTRLMCNRKVTVHEDALKKTEIMIKLGMQMITRIRQKAVRRSLSCSYET